MAKRSPTRQPAAGTGRFILSTVVAIAVATAIAHVISARPDHTWMWGAHFYRFFPTWMLIVATLALAAVIVAATLRREVLAAALTKALSPALVGRRFVAAAAVCVVAGTVLFWFARISHTCLGDGNIIVEQIDISQQLLEREPLSSLLQYAVYRTTKPWFYDENRSIELNAQDALAPGSVLAGLFFLTIAWFLAAELARLFGAKDNRQARVIAVLLWFVLVTQGYVQLFFGYIENYTFYAVGVAAYLWLALRHLRGAAPLLYPALGLILCFALHLSSLVLGASFAVLAVAAVARRATRRAALRDLAIAAGVVAVVVFAFSRVRAGYNPLATLVSMAHTAFADESTRGYMFSSAHYRDFFNEQLLIGPLGMFLFVPATVAALLTPGVRRRPEVWFSVVAGVGFLVACWMIGDSNLGYSRDWDLLSHSGLVFTTGALVLLMLPRVRTAVVMAALTCALATSLYHTAPWVAVNANAERSVARLATLPLGMGRTEVMLSTYYRQRGDTDRQRRWLQRALQVNPGNVNAIYLLGTVELATGRYEEAVVAFNEAVRMRPDKMEFRMSLVKALGALNRLSEAIPHLELIVRAEPGNLPAQVTLGEALMGMGRIAEAQAVFQKAGTLCGPIAAQYPNDARVAVTHGFILLRLGRLDEAEHEITRAASLDPQLADAHCFLGYVYREQGRAAEARVQFEACLTMNPGFGGRFEIDNWLAQNPP